MPFDNSKFESCPTLRQISKFKQNQYFVAKLYRYTVIRPIIEKT